MKQHLPFIASILLSPLAAGDISQWVEQSTQPPDPEVRESIEKPAPLTAKDYSWLLKNGEDPPCGVTHPSSAEEPAVMVCISFSTPTSVWTALSKALDKQGGAFLIRGLPDNSFAELAARIRKLGQHGVHAPIILNPKKFVEHSVVRVPTFIISGPKGTDTVVGNVSLSWVLERVQREGESGFMPMEAAHADI